MFNWCSFIEHKHVCIFILNMYLTNETDLHTIQLGENVKNWAIWKKYLPTLNHNHNIMCSDGVRQSNSLQEIDTWRTNIYTHNNAAIQNTAILRFIIPYRSHFASWFKINTHPYPLESKYVRHIFTFLKFNDVVF